MRRLSLLALLLLTFVAGPAGAQPSPAGPVNVSDTPGESTAPTIATPAGGTRHVAWQEEDGFVYTAIGDTTGWITSSFSIGDSPVLAAGSDDVVHLAYVADDGTGNLEIYHSRWSAGSWSPPANVSLTSGASADPDLAVAPDGTPHFVWVDATPGTPTLYHGTPDGANPVFEAQGTAPAIAVDGEGQVYFAWQETDADTGLDEVYYTWSGGIFAVNLSDSPAVDSRTPDLAIMPDGTVHAAWIEGGAVETRSGQATSFTTPTQLSEVATGTAGVQLASDGAGNLFAAWTEDESRVEATVRWAATSTWDTPQTVIASLIGLEAVALAAEPDNSVQMAWSTYPPNGIAGDIYAATVEFALPASHNVYLPLLARSD